MLASRVVERLKKLSSLQKLNFDNTSQQKHAKLGMNLFNPCPILLDFFTLFQIFCSGLPEQTNFWP